MLRFSEFSRLPEFQSLSANKQTLKSHMLLFLSGKTSKYRPISRGRVLQRTLVIKYQISFHNSYLRLRKNPVQRRTWLLLIGAVGVAGATWSYFAPQRLVEAEGGITFLLRISKAYTLVSES